MCRIVQRSQARLALVWAQVLYVFRNVAFREDTVWGPTSIGTIGTLGPVGPIAAAVISGGSFFSGPISSGPISTISTSTGATIMGVEGALAVLGPAKLQ